MCVCRLENALRNFACLTTGDVIAINYNEKVSVSTMEPAGPGAQSAEVTSNEDLPCPSFSREYFGGFFPSLVFVRFTHASSSPFLTAE